jgi:membrane protein YqaA with SNARE-associated domain
MLVGIIGAETWRLMRRLGGIGLVAVGIVDSSLIPIPGSLDFLTIVLTASERSWWIYYAAMATAGAVAGGYLTYRLGRKGGKEAIEESFPKRKTERVFHFFEKWGFGTVLVPAMLPPPVPIVPFLLCAGALDYPRKKFLAALIAGRAARFTLVAYLASRFGRRVVRLIERNGQVVVVLVAIALVVSAAALLVYAIARKQKSGRVRLW